MYHKLLFSALAIMVSSAVYAENNNFKMLDTDKNGAISEAEAIALPSLSEKWSKYDSNKNDELDEAEFARFETEEVE